MIYKHRYGKKALTDYCTKTMIAAKTIVTNELLQVPLGCTFHVILPQYPEAQAHAFPGFLFELAMLHSGFCVDAPTS